MGIVFFNVKKNQWIGMILSFLEKLHFIHSLLFENDKHDFKRNSNQTLLFQIRTFLLILKSKALPLS